MGLGYYFESDKEYNFENSISMSIELGKTCFSPGELVKGGIILKPKSGNVLNYLQTPSAFLSITENALYTYTEEERDPHSNTRRYVTKSAKEKIPILNIPLDLSIYNNTEIVDTLKFNFTFQIPLRIYPSCFFGSNTYVKHYLTVDFPSISARKSLIIVIKNPPYFSVYNHLYQSPAMSYKEMKKSKLFFSQGYFIASIKIPKNAFAYDEVIPFEIDIDLTKLTMDIKYIKVAIRRISKKNLQYDHNKTYHKETRDIAFKNLEFNKSERRIKINDIIEIDVDKNPKNIYYKLDNDNRRVNQKFSGIYLYPTCNGGLLSVEYFLKMEIVMDTFWSTNEEFLIPIDLFEPFANEPNMTQNMINPQVNDYYQSPYPSPFGLKTQINKQNTPTISPKITPIQQINQNNSNENNLQDNLPSIEEVMKKTPEDENPAPPSMMNININNNDFK